MASPKNFAASLNAWYRQNSRDLPWRRTRDPYLIWISEIMLQQTTVNTVIPYYERWMAAFPNVTDVARAPVDRVLKCWQGLGYYQRARNIHRAARTIIKDFDGRIPEDPRALRRLPGFGPYTVNAVASIAFDQRAPLIDTNVRRVVMRLKGITGPADSRQDKEIRTFLEQVMPRRNISIFNQALMELGALICRWREPLCRSCPVRSACAAYKQGLTTVIPAAEKMVVENIEAVIGIIRHNGKFFIQRRPPKGLMAGLWEFPGGGIEAGETPGQALQREIREELGRGICSQRPLFKVRHAYTRFRVKLHVWDCRLMTSPKTDRTHKWVSSRELAKVPMPSINARIIERLKRPAIQHGRTQPRTSRVSRSDAGSPKILRRS